MSIEHSKEENGTRRTKHRLLCSHQKMISTETWNAERDRSGKIHRHGRMKFAKHWLCVCCCEYHNAKQQFPAAAVTYTHTHTHQEWQTHPKCCNWCFVYDQRRSIAKCVFGRLISNDRRPQTSVRVSVWPQQSVKAQLYRARWRWTPLTLSHSLHCCYRWVNWASLLL